jgi:hypothetical protein
MLMEMRCQRFVDRRREPPERVFVCTNRVKMYFYSPGVSVYGPFVRSYCLAHGQPFADAIKNGEIIWKEILEEEFVVYQIMLS